MPTCRLPAITAAPNAIIAMATPISTPRWVGPVPPACDVASVISSSTRILAREQATGGVAPPALLRGLSSVRLCEEARFFHQVAVTVLFLLDPLGVFRAAHEGLVEGTVPHQGLPLRRLAHLLEQVDIERHLIGCGVRCHEHAAQHQVLDVET